jgi:hypothetical protein
MARRMACPAPPREIREHLAQWAVHPCERLLPGQDVRRTRLDQSRAMPQPCAHETPLHSRATRGVP